jgi:hypothetical protein
MLRDHIADLEKLEADFIQPMKKIIREIRIEDNEDQPGRSELRGRPKSFDKWGLRDAAESEIRVRSKIPDMDLRVSVGLKPVTMQENDWVDLEVRVGYTGNPEGVSAAYADGAITVMIKRRREEFFEKERPIKDALDHFLREISGRLQEIKPEIIADMKRRKTTNEPTTLVHRVLLEMSVGKSGGYKSPALKREDAAKRVPRWARDVKDHKEQHVYDALDGLSEFVQMHHLRNFIRYIALVRDAEDREAMMNAAAADLSLARGKTQTKVGEMVEKLIGELSDGNSREHQAALEHLIDLLGRAFLKRRDDLLSRAEAALALQRTGAHGRSELRTKSARRFLGEEEAPSERKHLIIPLEVLKGRSELRERLSQLIEERKGDSTLQIDLISDEYRNGLQMEQAVASLFGGRNIPIESEMVQFYSKERLGISRAGANTAHAISRLLDQLRSDESANADGVHRVVIGDDNVFARFTRRDTPKLIATKSSIDAALLVFELPDIAAWIQMAGPAGILKPTEALLAVIQRVIAGEMKLSMAA